MNIPNSPSQPNQARGIFASFRIRLFGERDFIEDQLREISKQGAGMARAAHACSTLLIVLFSLGSLVALGGDALTRILADWGKGRLDVPDAISIAVSFLVVVCMDIGMVYAASMLRLLTARRAPREEKRLHEAVMLIVAVLEAGTYSYMSIHYEHPTNLAVWMLILARAAAAPLLSVYLSMARVLPVLPRDILYQAELAVGKGVLKDVVELANDSTAPLSKKLNMYRAASMMSEADRARLVELVQVVQSAEQMSPPLELLSKAEPAPDFPTGGGTPAQVEVAEASNDATDDTTNLVALEARSEDVYQVPLRPAASGAEPSRQKSQWKGVPEKAIRAFAFALLDEWQADNGEPMSKVAFRERMGINQTHARRLYSQWMVARTSQPQVQPVSLVEDVAQ